MSAFDANFAAGAAASLLAVHGEDVTYTPHGGAARTIVAIVERDARTTISEGARTPSATMTVLSTNGASKTDDGFGGIGLDEIKPGGDTIGYTVRKGEATSTRRIGSIVEQAGGMLIVEVR